MTHFECMERVIVQEPNVLNLFKTIRTKFPKDHHIAEFAEWNVNVLERCLKERSVPGLMAWESTMRAFLAYNAHQGHTAMHRNMTQRLDELVIAYNCAMFASLTM